MQANPLRKLQVRSNFHETDVKKNRQLTKKGIKLLARTFWSSSKNGFHI